MPASVRSKDRSSAAPGSGRSSAHGRSRISNRVELTAEDRLHIHELFNEKVAPELMALDARTGVLDCGFAGERYSRWTLTFRSAGSGFEIVDFEYDEDSGSVSLEDLE